jgi:small subunit ribosomal protein S2
MENVVTDVSIKEEDQEVDIESYATTTTEESPVVKTEVPETPPEEEDELPVDVDKVYGGE